MAPAPADELIDALGTRHGVAGAAARIVSLVPSITELLFDLDLGAQVIGRTGFCIHPRMQVRKVPKVGGTKTIDVARIERLRPTHLIVNIDENPRPLVEETARFVPHVVVTHPLHPRDNLALYRLLGGIFGREKRAEALCRDFERAYAAVLQNAESWPPQRVLYLIWKAPWMTISQDTYIARMLATVGWQVVAPTSDDRYPTLALDADDPIRRGLGAAVHRTVRLSRAALRGDPRYASARLAHAGGVDRRVDDLLVRQPRDRRSCLLERVSPLAGLNGFCSEGKPLTPQWPKWKSKLFVGEHAALMAPNAHVAENMKVTVYQVS